MEKIILPYQFVPRNYQRKQFEAYEQGQKRFVKVWHRRSGKDLTDLNFTVCRAMERVGNYYHLFPTYAQGKKVIWQGKDKTGRPFLDYIPRQIIDGQPNETEMRVPFKNGSAYQIIGTDNIDAVMGVNPVGVIFSEYSLQDPFAWDRIRPILRENNGWAIFNFTPRGENHAHDLWLKSERAGWFRQLLTVNDTTDDVGKPIITGADIEQERLEGMSEEMIQQDYFCSFQSAMAGAYYSEQIKSMEDSGRIGLVPWDERKDVFTFWDLGMNDTMFILCVQQDGFSYSIIDVVFDHGKGFEYYKNELGMKPYRYAAHFVPHDAKVRELGTGKQRSQTLESMLREPVEILPRPKLVTDKVEATRHFLRKVSIDKEKCNYLVNALKNYRQKYDERAKMWSNEPLHDWSSHGCDALAYLALYVREGGDLSSYSGSTGGGVSQGQTINIQTYGQREQTRDPYAI